MMKISNIQARRRIAGISAGMLAGGLAMGISGAPSAIAAPDCSPSGVNTTVSSVTGAAQQYLAAHPDANQALIDITRQSSFVAIGQVDGYFAEHPQQADEIRAINAPLTDFKDRCGLQVSPTDALTVLADI